MQKTELKFNSAVCTTREQSQRLLDLGLKAETADMYYLWLGGNDYRLKVDVGNNPLKYNMDKTYIPAWSLHRLMCMLYTREDVYPIMPSTAYEDIIDDIENEIKCGGFNKEYLKQ